MKVIVIGAGVFGSWSAKFLADAGHSVTLVDAYGAANGRSSSADHSRIIRAGYGADEIYSRWATSAYRDWEWLANISGQPLLTRTGALFLGPSGNAYIRATLATLTRLGVAAEQISATELQRRFPQIETSGLDVAVFEHAAGVLRARRAVRALVDVLTDRGMPHVLQRVAPVDEQRAVCTVRTHQGAALAADAFVFACGPWLPKIFPQAIGARVRATRQEVLYFGVPAGSARFSVPNLPVWIDFSAGLYGVPDIAGDGFKVGIDRHGELVDPDTLDRVVDDTIVTTTRAWLATRFPELAGAPVVDARVCQYENTSTGDFIIDRHPMWPHCWIVGGGSGHGFKHGPSIGRQVAALVNGAEEVNPRFALAGKATIASRAVY